MKLTKITGILITTVILITTLSDVSIAQKKNKKGKNNKEQTDTEKPKKKDDKNGIKPYKDVITSKAKTDDGLFKVHKVEEKFYYDDRYACRYLARIAVWKQH